MARAILALPLFILFLWTFNLNNPPTRECIEWEWVTVSMMKTHGVGSHFGLQPTKVRTCKNWSNYG